MSGTENQQKSDTRFSKFLPKVTPDVAKQVHYEVENNKTNANGEVLDERTSTIVTKQPSTPDFTMVFSRDLGYLKNITAGASKLLFGLIQVVDRNNEITLNKARKEQIAESTGLKLTSIDVLLKQLKTKEVILSANRGIYKLNPFLFGKGSWKNIRKMRMTLEYDFDENKRTMTYENECVEDANGFDSEIPYQILSNQEKDSGVTIPQKTDTTKKEAPASELTSKEKLLGKLGDLDEGTLKQLTDLLTQGAN